MPDHYNIQYTSSRVNGLVNGITFNHTSAKPVLISGLNLKRDPSVSSSAFPLLTISTISPVTIIDSDIQGVGSADQGPCLVLRGNGHTVRGGNFHDCNVAIQNEATDTHIEAVTVYNSKTGIRAMGNNATVIGSTIRNSDVGVKIEGSNNFLGATSEVTFDAEANIIHDNKQGIVQQAGTENNKFA